jgi:MYXO-CTERM domain-containing protein
MEGGLTGLLLFLGWMTPPVYAQEVPCLTPTLMQKWGDKPIMRAYPPVPPLPGKSDRDAWGEWPNDRFSENFVVKWGSDTISSERINGLLDAFEAAWVVHVQEMEFEAPVGSQDYRFNVYIGDSGPDTLSGHGAAGYFSYDQEGWPLIVIAKNSLNADDGGAGTAVHEFFHAVQDAMDTWDYTSLGAWYYEATACWSVPEVLPGDLTYMSFVMGYALLPNYSVNFFDYWDTGAFPEYHQYGAFLFPRYLTEHVLDWRLVRDSWRENNSLNDPLQAIEDLLQAEGEDLDQVFSDFAAHNAIWDYSDGATYDEYVEYYAGQFSEWDCRVSDALGSGGDSDWRDANPDCLPQSYGYNLISINNPKSGHLSVAFEGEDNGSRESATTWKLQLVREGGSGLRYTPVDLEDNATESVLCDVGDEDALFVVVSTHAQRFKDEEIFGYKSKIQIVDSHLDCGDSPVDTGEPPDRDPTNPGSNPGVVGGLGDGEAQGCGCTSATPRSFPRAALGLVVFGFFGLRRRPYTASCSIPGKRSSKEGI